MNWFALAVGFGVPALLFYFARGDDSVIDEDWDD